MSDLEKKTLEDLIASSSNKCLGSFYVKSGVLKIISDFFYKLKERKSFSVNTKCLDILIEKAKDCLDNNMHCSLPNLKELAAELSISESTLKRHFKKKYGVTMSSYFAVQKMNCAKHLIEDKKVSLNDTASILDYQNAE